MAELKVIDAEPVSANVVEYLEHLLANAKDGKYSALAAAFVYRDGSTGSGFSEQHNLATMTGAVAGLQAKLTRTMLGDD